MMSNEHLPCPLERAKNPFTCGISGRTFTALEQKERVDILKRQLKKEMGWEVNQGSEWNKVVGIYAFNTVSDDFFESRDGYRDYIRIRSRESHLALIREPITNLPNRSTP